MQFELLLLITIIAGFSLLIFILKQYLDKITSSKNSSQDFMNIISLLERGSKEDRKMLLETLSQNTNALNMRLDRATNVIAQVERSIGEVSEIGRSMKDVSEFLRSPKIRGTLGEQVLKELLTQLLPKQSFKLQYRFSDGSIVDAAILSRGNIIPIDSKFPMEQFRAFTKAEQKEVRDKARHDFILAVKKHTKSIAEKYIRTNEGTTDYALMYLPSEAIYYEIVNDPDIYEYSSKERVLPVSPTTFYAFLKAILISFEGERIEKNAQEIIRSFRALETEYNKLDGILTTLIRHITNAYTTSATAMQQFTKLGRTLTMTPQFSNKKQKELIE